jgi:hypothetical protein
MNAYLILVGRARALLAHGRNREMILAQILAEPCFEEYVRDDTYHQSLTTDQKVAFAKKILADAIDKEARRLV